MTDKDLAFLEDCSNGELDVLVKIMLKKLTEELTINDRYKKDAPNHKMYVDLIEEEFIKFGSHSIGRHFFGNKSYREIVADVCKQTKTPFHKAASVERMENALLEKMLYDTWERLSPEEREKLLEELGKKARFAMSKKGMGASAFVSLLRMGGFASYTLPLIIANGVARFALGRGLAFAANAGLTRALGVIAGPVGMAVSSILLVADIAGPAYTVTIPLVVYIAALRRMKEAEDMFGGIFSGSMDDDDEDDEED